jgi:type IV fimbrial biogenesis protein FimT
MPGTCISPGVPSTAEVRPTFRHVTGFTLLELMTSIAVLATLAALSVPMFTSFTRNQRVKAATSDLTYALIQARGEALKRNANVVVSPDASGWQFGWTLTTAGVTGNLLAQTTPTYKNSSGVVTSYLTITGPGTVTYNGSGRLTATVTPFTIASAVGSTTEVKPRCVSIDLSGLPRSTVSSSGTCP